MPHPTVKLMKVTPSMLRPGTILVKADYPYYSGKGDKEPSWIRYVISTDGDIRYTTFIDGKCDGYLTRCSGQSMCRWSCGIYEPDEITRARFQEQVEALDQYTTTDMLKLHASFDMFTALEAIEKWLDFDGSAEEETALYDHASMLMKYALLKARGGSQ